ncbi:hypothetical protein [Nocardia asteroides]|uniref:hypothetical protein n=1 Tax=Nocardia asteroides TaxID=1824 RepID=UPI0033C60ADD
MTALETEILDKLNDPPRSLYTEALAAILQRPRAEIDRAVMALYDRRLVWRNRAGQWAAR